MRQPVRGLLGAWLVLLGGAVAATAGMPAPLPEHPEQVLRLTEPAVMRLATISFFLAGLLVCAAVVRWLWNGLGKDFPNLPRLTYLRALGAVLLWGLLFVIVLTMISGARELMTPGAWKKQGWTYQLSDDSALAAQTAERAYRRQHLERLRTALWHFAATHGGRFPSDDERTLIPAELWEVPESGGLRYRYLAGRSADDARSPLAVEPEVDAAGRLVLFINGEVERLRPADLAKLLEGEGKP
jgi:hypothetical protein